MALVCLYHSDLFFLGELRIGMALHHGGAGKRQAVGKERGTKLAKRQTCGYFGSHLRINLNDILKQIGA